MVGLTMVVMPLYNYCCIMVNEPYGLTMAWYNQLCKGKSCSRYKLAQDTLAYLPNQYRQITKGQSNLAKAASNNTGPWRHLANEPENPIPDKALPHSPSPELQWQSNTMCKSLHLKQDLDPFSRFRAAARQTDAPRYGIIGRTIVWS